MQSGTRLQHKAALITGGAGGIGAATARAFCGEGAAVLLVDANEAALAQVADRLRQQYPHARIECLRADISQEDDARRAVDQAQAAFGRLDVLVNNAAMRNYSALSQATPAEWQAMVAVNLIGTSNYCKAALPLLRQAEKASIVNVSSCYAVTGRKGMGLYDATKAGMLAFTRTLAFEEAEHGIRVNAVCPGSTLTDFHVQRAQAAGKDVETLKTQRQDTSLLRRWAAPEEIAWPILWLASDEASFITGTTLLVDGGLHIM
ncbi:MAG: SDR family oxidoreductase [Burkholderiaceae bacterium]|jgi:meso-butanediol dehydrogenase/(S,S)-butanediol dehydrogenase/diacetyl reductase|nr:SDR family oxidoreductase [Burkholderiaceae bacterium]